MATREDIVREAREWINTRWEHQQNSKGLGCDCEGFIEGVALNVGVIDLAVVARNYRRREDSDLMLRILEEHLEFVAGSQTREVPDMSKARPGDIIAFCDEELRKPEKPRHLGIMTERRADGVIKVIHASEHGVREHRMDARWLKRVHSVWKVKELE